MNRVRLRPAASADVEAAAQWYADQDPALEQQFLSSVAATLNKIEAWPHLFPIVYRDVRRALLNRFPYGLYFVVRTPHVVVVACMHAKRDPIKWKGRSSG